MNPRRSNTSLPQPGRSAYGIATAVVLVLIPVVVVLGGNWLQEFLNFGAGVLSLVSLTCSVIWGLVAQDRLILNTRQRIVAQGIHRVTAVASIAFLLVHISIKLALEHTVLIGALIPFSLGISGSGGLIGLGSLAALLMIFVGVTGALRNQFASPAATAARWRMMHMMAYPALCAALVHGLFAGRAAKPFFVVSYQLCLVGVIAALALRAAPRSFKRKVADRLGAIIGSEGGMRDDLEQSRARVAESGPQERAPRAERERPAAPKTSSLFGTPAPEAGGFAAAYRNAPPTPQPTYGAGMPYDTQATAAMPRMDGPGSTSGSWPVPSPPPVGEAPPSAYDPMQDTGFNIPVYGTPQPGQTPNPNDPYNNGTPPGSGEAWNTPSGGYR
ncbi:cytochrome b/b6 domain-containing protein [Streptomyces niveiscabiei]|uniref:cytochrome b/b6 domain-containing protein n=1 Tax=Streptomyces niveiscabiei TaxID=164115 RepID=UPI0029AD073F|nr:cytochrome b/b6 domain-containing protein [Streptomyces niveiscabiei]MDX3385576.1 cytochrome b/b6 domain-containing protein [Streptomyces niveiscabiei]